MNVLLIDDQEDVRMVAKLVIMMLGDEYRVVEAGGYEEGMALFASETFDLVITDYDFKTAKNGLDIITDLRITAEVPVILLSASFDEKPELRAKAHESGAVACIAKPYELKQLRSAIRLALAA